MNILYFSQFYAPESIAAAFRATENSKLWKQSGHEVTVFTGYPNYPVGKIFDGYDPKLLTEECINGVRVLRSKLIAKPNTSMAARLQNALGYFFFGWINTHFQKKKIGKDFDVVIGTSGVIFNALLAKLFASKIKKPYIFEIRDITYRQLIATGKSESSFSVKLMKKFELFLCHRAQRVVVVTDGFKNILMAEGIDESKISVITNGVEISPLGMRKSVADSVNLSYFGTLGISQKIEETFSYAVEIKKVLHNFTYQIIGEGAQRSAIEALLADGSYPYVELLHGMTPEELEPYYEKTNLSVVTLAKSEDFEYTLPSKLFQIMGRGIAVLFIGPDGEAADIVRKNHAGIVLCGTLKEDIQVLRNFFTQSDYQEQLDKMGRNGYEAVYRHYDRKILAADYLELLRTCLA